MKLIAAVLGAFLGLILVAPAAAAPSIQAGQFCGQSDHYDVKIADNGDTVKCLPSGDKWKWTKVTPSASSSKSQSASASASASKSASAKPSTSSTPAANASSDALPLTGAPVPLIVITALLVLAAGSGLIYAARRRTRFTA